MSIVDPIADDQWGLVNWEDYKNYWREEDAEYLQSRTVMRFHNNTGRDVLGTDSAKLKGTVVYNEAVDRLQWRGATEWLDIRPLPVNLSIAKDDNTGVDLAHNAAGGKGLSLMPNGDVKVNGLAFDAVVGTFKVTPAGISVKTGTSKEVTLTTDASGPVIGKAAGDPPDYFPRLRVPSITLTDATNAVNVLDATGKQIKVGTVIVDTKIEAPTVDLKGGAITGNGTLDGSKGTIGGVKVGVTANRVDATAGLLADGAIFDGDGAQALMSFSAKEGLIAVDDKIRLGKIYSGGATPPAGSGIEVNADVVVRNARTITWWDTPGTHTAPYAVVVYSAADPGVTNYPEGTLWVS